MFEAVIMQAAESSVESNAVAVILALASIAGIIGKIILDRSQDSKVGKYLTTFGQKTAEQQDELYILASALKAGSPEAVKYLDEKYGKNVEYFRRRAEAAEAQLSKLGQKVPDNMQANKDISIGNLDPAALQTTTKTRTDFQ